MSVKLLLRLNRRVRPTLHPFNAEISGGESYGMWEYRRGGATVSLYSPEFDGTEMFFGKDVLDVGCGEGGKSLCYASLGAKSVVGVDTVKEYKEKSDALANALGFSNYTFVCASALALPFDGESFDTVIMSDFFEHVSDPLGALYEAMRVLRPGGRLFINFPPYYHPYGAHLSDAINIPWVHLFFREKTLIAAYKTLIADKSDAKRRLKLKITTDERGAEHIGYINKMTLKKARRIIKESGLAPKMKKYVPLRKFLAPAAHIPVLREFFVKAAVYVFEKPAEASKKEEFTSRNI